MNIVVVNSVAFIFVFFLRFNSAKTETRLQLNLKPLDLSLRNLYLYNCMNGSFLLPIKIVLPSSTNDGVPSLKNYHIDDLIDSVVQLSHKHHSSSELSPNFMKFLPYINVSMARRDWDNNLEKYRMRHRVQDPSRFRLASAPNFIISFDSFWKEYIPHAKYYNVIGEFNQPNDILIWLNYEETKFIEIIQNTKESYLFQQNFKFNATGTFGLCLFCIKNTDHRWKLVYKKESLNVCTSSYKQKYPRTFPGWPYYVKYILGVDYTIQVKYLMQFGPSLNAERSIDQFATMELTRALNLSGFYCGYFTGCSKPASFVVSDSAYETGGTLFYYGENFETSFVALASTNSLSFVRLMGPLNWQLLVTIVTLLFVLVVLLSLLLKVESKIYGTAKSKHRTVVKMFETLLRPLLDENHTWSPSNRISFRSIFITWHCACFVILESYKSGLVGYLIRPLFPEVPSNFKELLQQPDIEVCPLESRNWNPKDYSMVIESLFLFSTSCTMTSSYDALGNFRAGEDQSCIIETRLQKCKWLDEATSFEKSYKNLVIKEGALVGSRIQLKALADLSTPSMENFLSEDTVSYYKYWNLKQDIYSQSGQVVLRRLTDSGIMGQFLRYAERHQYLNTMRTVRNISGFTLNLYEKESKEPTSLKLIHLVPIILVWASIAAVALVVFIVGKILYLFCHVKV